MYQKLFSIIQKPLLWQRSNELFWDDEHISKGMLEMHLNPDLELASRTSITIEQSMKWLSTLIHKGCKILDLGCGPGLYAKQLSLLAYDITGIDYSRRSLEYAKKQDNMSQYIYQNYLEIDFEDEFDAIL